MHGIVATDDALHPPVQRVSDINRRAALVGLNLPYNRQPKLSRVKYLETNAVPISLQPVRQGADLLEGLDAQDSGSLGFTDSLYSEQVKRDMYLGQHRALDRGRQTGAG
jgi:hypothetical protein